MRKLGLLGGMSWESTIVYYRLLNEAVRQRLGGLHSAPLVIESVDFAACAAMQAAGDWSGLEAHLCRLARGLVAAGAEAVLIATNTMHRLAPQVEQAAGVPLLHIGDAVGAALARDGRRQVVLLGTRFTMTQPFMSERIAGVAGCAFVRPSDAEIELVHHAIYDELCRGQVRDQTRQAVLGAIERLVHEEQADAVVLGCTELPLLLTEAAAPLYDTVALHCAAAAEWILSG